MAECGAGVQIKAPVKGRFMEIVTPEAIAFLVDLHRKFNPRRKELLAARVERQRRLDAGERLDFLPETTQIRESHWTVAPLPKELLDRRVEITGRSIARRSSTRLTPARESSRQILKTRQPLLGRT